MSRSSPSNPTKGENSPLLNERQAEAVDATDGPLLIVAGAGSGKTRVITYRIARLLSKGVPQSEILAVTFTNKAAKEMAQRVRELIPRKLTRLTVCTFHAFGAQVLRERFALLGYRPNFSIYDSHDQASLLRETAREIGLKGESIDLQAAAQLISSVKTGRAKWSSASKHLKPLFREYQRNLRLYNAVDFDDLIMLPLELLQKFPEVRRESHERYRYLLVDEFQDTSAAQYDLMKLLVGPEENVCVVGDDDQSIYSWRGANYQNILRFERDYPRMREITLEQNYRSTRTILRAANALIAGNTNRKPKALWSGLPEGEPIELCNCESEQEEADYIVSRIRTLIIRESLSLQDFGVLLRANHLTRSLEEAFRRENIPYSVSGGMSFFERQEVRDMLAYLKAIANHDDDTSLLRIINTPRRGIGKKLLERATEHAAAHHCSLFSAMAAFSTQPGALGSRKSHGQRPPSL
jgi:DNA helicase II / ATP-dependent DNA helicase PcrA